MLAESSYFINFHQALSIPMMSTEMSQVGVALFKNAVGDVISIRGQVMEYLYIPTGIKRELVRFGMDYDS